MQSIEIPYGVVLSQECDLDKDFKVRQEKGANNDKYLPTILVCPAYLSDQFKAGTHIDSWEMETFGNKKVRKLTQNYEYPRYHYLESEPSLGVPELIIDFKHFMTVPRDSLYSNRVKSYVATLNELFREDLSQRFAAYLSRIGLPEFNVTESDSPEA